MGPYGDKILTITNKEVILLSLSLSNRLSRLHGKDWFMSRYIFLKIARSRQYLDPSNLLTPERRAKHLKFAGF